MRIKNIANGEVLNNIKIIQNSKKNTVTANESEVESAFENYLKDIGYGEVGKYYTKRTARSKVDIFPSKTGAKVGLICQHFIGQKIYNLTNHFKT